MKNKIKWDGKLVQFTELLLDIILVVAIYVFSVVIISGLPFADFFEPGPLRRDLVVMSFSLALGVFLFFRIYNITITQRGYLSVMFRIAVSLGILTFLLFFTTLIVTSDLPKSSVFLMFVIQLLSFAVLKGIAYMILRRINIKTAIIIGPKEEVYNLTKKIIKDDNKYVQPNYLVYDEGEIKYEKIFSYIDAVDSVYLTEFLDTVHKNTIISYCLTTNKSFYLVPKLYEITINNAKFNQAGDTMLYGVNRFGLTLEQRFVKRTFDLVFSILLMIITAPIMIAAAVAIKLQDKGPILFKQERITRNNRKFMLYKFRTMIPDAEAKSGPVLATNNDERITKIGKFLRATRIDELPQLINIIKGEMSIVGPRPERDFFIEQFVKENNDYQYRLHVKAGVTGLAQAMGTYNTEFSEKLRFDIYYIANYSIFKDINIILQTVRSVFDPNSAKGISASTSLEDILEEENYFIFKTDDPNIDILIKK